MGLNKSLPFIMKNNIDSSMKCLKILLVGIFLTFSLESLSTLDNKTQQLLKNLRSTESDVRISAIKDSKEVASEDPRVHKA